MQLPLCDPPTEEIQDTIVPLDDAEHWRNFIADVKDLGRNGSWDAIWREDVVAFRRTCRQMRKCVYCHGEYQAAFNIADLLCTWRNVKTGKDYATEHYSSRVHRNSGDTRECSLREFYVYLTLGYPLPPPSRVIAAKLHFEDGEDCPCPDKSYLLLRCYVLIED